MASLRPGDAAPRAPRRQAKPVTVTRLENVAAAYVARYDASSARLRAVLMRRVLRARREAAPIVADVEAVIDGIVARYVRSGIIDDARYAERNAARLHRRGTSQRYIREKLKLAGIDRDQTDRALDATRAELPGDATDLDLRAAVALARRRRLGPFRAAADRRERRNKDLAALGRAGFALDIARRVVDADDAATLLAEQEAS